MRIERLTAPGAWLGEGPTWNADTGELIWVDILAGKINITEPETGNTSSIATLSEVGAVVLDEDGLLIAAMVDGVYRYSNGEWRLTTALEPDDPKTRPNDGKVDPFGALVVGTMPWNGEVPTGSLYRIRAGAKPEKLLSELSIPNGLVWAEGEFWHIDSPTKLIRKYKYDATGPLEETADFIDVGPPGGPDGMTIDTDGCMWVAIWGGAAVRRYSPSGALIEEFSLPVSHVSSCTFGGPNLDLLFITTATKDLEDPSSEPLAGSVFVAEPGVSGFEPFRLGSG